MTDDFSRGVLYPVLRSGMGLEQKNIPLSQDDCRTLFSLGQQQAILPVIYRGLRKQGVPREWLEEQKQAQSTCLYRYVLLDDALKKIGAALDKAGIPWLPLKGAVIRDLYPEAWLRTSTDVDVLVHPEDLERALQALEAETDFRTGDRDYHDVAMNSPNVLLELHFSLLENSERLDPLLARVWEFAVPTGQGCRWEMAPEYLLFHILAHMSYHLLHGGLGLRPFLDLWLLEHRTVFDREKLRLLSAHGIGRISVNPQTMHDETLSLIGRRHTVQDTLRAFALAREEGFRDINMDLIAGLPGENETMFERSCEEIERLSPESLTVHTLTIKHASLLHLWEAKLPDGDMAARMVRRGREAAAAMGMKPYYLYRQKYMAGNLENTAYALPGCESLYNIGMMEETADVVAVGAGAISKRVNTKTGKILRAPNVSDIGEYISRVPEMTKRKEALLDAEI